MENYFNIIFWFIEKFVLSKQGGRCENEFSLLTKEDCKLSIETIKKTYPDAKACSTNTWNHRPKGCFLHRLNNCVHANLAVTGAKNAQDVQICAGMYGIDFLINCFHFTIFSMYQIIFSISYCTFLFQNKTWDENKSKNKDLPASVLKHWTGFRKIQNKFESLQKRNSFIHFLFVKLQLIFPFKRNKLKVRAENIFYAFINHIVLESDIVVLLTWFKVLTSHEL